MRLTGSEQDLVRIETHPARVEAEIHFALGQHFVEVLLLTAELLLGRFHHGPVDRERLPMPGTDHVRFMLDQVADRLQVAVVLDMVAEDEIVAESSVGALREEGIAGERDPVAVNGCEQRHLILRVAGRVRDLELELFPTEFLAVTEGLRYPERFWQRAPEIVAARILKDVLHVLVAPDFGSVVPREMRKAVHVVVVHVRGHGDLDGLQSIGSFQLGYVVLDEAHAIRGRGSLLEVREMRVRRRAVVDEHRFSAVADDRVERRCRQMVCHQVTAHRKRPEREHRIGAGLEAIVVGQFADRSCDGGVGIGNGIAVRWTQ